MLSLARLDLPVRSVLLAWLFTKRTTASGKSGRYIGVEDLVSRATHYRWNSQGSKVRGARSTWDQPQQGGLHHPTPRDATVDVACLRVQLLAKVLSLVFKFERVLAALRADSDFDRAERAAEAAPPFLPPFRAGALLTGFPRPEPESFPLPPILFTVAQALFSASGSDPPCSSYPCSMCSACRFCFSVYFDLSPLGMSSPHNDGCAASLAGTRRLTKTYSGWPGLR
jgi:hypothetical protein